MLIHESNSANSRTEPKPRRAAFTIRRRVAATLALAAITASAGGCAVTGRSTAPNGARSGGPDQTLSAVRSTAAQALQCDPAELTGAHLQGLQQTTSLSQVAIIDNDLQRIHDAGTLGRYLACLPVLKPLAGER
jgi:hypothetical protein